MKWLMGYTTDFTEGEYASAYSSLSPSRRAHIDTFRHLGARRQSLAGELLLRKLLAQNGIADTVIRLQSGQPALAGGQAFVSIAHCDDRIVCALSDMPVGIDIEKIKPVKPGMPERVCTPEELAWVQADPHRFFEIWTGKEACFKMLGTGITDFQSVNVLSLPRQVYRQDDYLIQIVYKQKR